MYLGAQGVAGNTKHTGSPGLVSAGAFQNFFDQGWFDFSQQHLIQVFRNGVSHILKVLANGDFYMLSQGNGLW